LYIPLAVTGATHGLRQLGTFGDTFVARVFSDDFAFLTSGICRGAGPTCRAPSLVVQLDLGSALGLCYRAAPSPRRHGNHGGSSIRRIVAGAASCLSRTQ